jgi:outer membrane protein OmpA-like peptidoglycan-associated protein
MKTQNAIQSLALTALVVLLGGCASSANAPIQAPGPGADSESVSFPDAGRAWLKGGAFVNVEQLRRIGRGMTKNQVRELISYPHFGEGLFGPKEWDYLFNFRTGRGEEFITCQYKVIFKDGLSEAMRWKEPACADFLRPKLVETPRVEPPRVETPVVSERFKLNADALFAFDKSSLADVLPEGRRQLQALAAQLASKSRQIDRITVIGFTDRLGSDTHNQALSLSRANAVRDFLVNQGIERTIVRTAGAGASQPVVQCPGERKTPALVNCLQPNRRVEVEVSSDRKG